MTIYCLSCVSVKALPALPTTLSMLLLMLLPPSLLNDCLLCTLLLMLLVYASSAPVPALARDLEAVSSASSPTEASLWVPVLVLVLVPAATGEAGLEVVFRI